MVWFVIFCFSLCLSHIAWCGRTPPKQNSRLVNPYLKADDPERDAVGALLVLSWWGQPIENYVLLKQIRITYRDKKRK